VIMGISGDGASVFKGSANGFDGELDIQSPKGKCRDIMRFLQNKRCLACEPRLGDNGFGEYRSAHVTSLFGRSKEGFRCLSLFRFMITTISRNWKFLLPWVNL
jgi:hypothetical protein